MKIKKKFTHQGIEIRIVEREEPYMNSKEPVKVTRVLAPNGGSIPVVLEHRDTLKKIQERTVILLDSFEKRGANIKEELTKTIQL